VGVGGRRWSAGGPVELRGKQGILCLKRKHGTWVANVASTLLELEPALGERIIGIDSGVKVPAAVLVINTGTCFVGNGRAQQAKKLRAVCKRQGKEARWMRDVNQKLSHQMVAHAQRQGEGVIRLEHRAGIHERRHSTRQRGSRTARTSGGARNARARTNTRLIATWTFHQLATCIAYKAARADIAVDWVDPAYTSQTCPACSQRNQATDRY